MRDPARIDVVCAALAQVWKRYPDYRLGQLVVNVSGVRDPFNIEDDVMLQLLQTYGMERIRTDDNNDKNSSSP